MTEEEGQQADGQNAEARQLQSTNRRRHEVLVKRGLKLTSKRELKANRRCLRKDTPQHLLSDFDCVLVTCSGLFCIVPVQLLDVARQRDDLEKDKLNNNNSRCEIIRRRICLLLCSLLKQTIAW